MGISMKLRPIARNSPSNSMGVSAQRRSGWQRERRMITHVITFDRPLSQAEIQHFQEVWQGLETDAERKVLMLGYGAHMERLDRSPFPSVRVRNARKARVR